MRCTTKRSFAERVFYAIPCAVAHRAARGPLFRALYEKKKKQNIPFFFLQSGQSKYPSFFDASATMAKKKGGLIGGVWVSPNHFFFMVGIDKTGALSHDSFERNRI